MEARKFEFTNYDVPVEIGGHEFVLDCSSDTGDYLKRCSNELREMAVAIGKGEKTSEDAVEYGFKMLDKLLGQGASDKIFEARKKRLSDVTDICLWLTGVATKFQEQRRANMQGNREQRRAAKKQSK